LADPFGRCRPRLNSRADSNANFAVEDIAAQLRKLQPTAWARAAPDQRRRTERDVVRAVHAFFSSFASISKLGIDSARSVSRFNC